MKRKPRYDTPIRIICAVLFATFSFLYIYMLQGELLALVQDHLAQGQTSNNTLITATIITLLLMALQYLLNKAGQLHGRYEAFSYLPSCVLLALITKVDNTYAYSWDQWIIAFVIVTALYLLFVWISKNMLESRAVKFLDLLSPNLGVLAAMFMFTGWYGNNTPDEQMELAAWKHTHSGKYEKVLKVGRKSADCNADLTALRNLALAKTGQLATMLFTYPQPYGSDGLLMKRYNVQTTAYGSQAFYNMLGATPYGGEDAAAFYKRMADKSSLPLYRDMYLASLLLDRDLTTFVSQIAGEQSVLSLGDAPTHYQEALMIYNEQHPFTPIDFVSDDVVSQRYHDYLTLREAHASDLVVMENLCKRHFGGTYWYYYDFVK